MTPRMSRFGASNSVRISAAVTVPVPSTGKAETSPDRERPTPVHAEGSEEWRVADRDSA
jgi:hypothetical protein